MAKTAKRLASIASAPWLTSVEDLVFYAIDKASPYNLALSQMSDSIAKIGKLNFAQLMIDKLGTVDHVDHHQRWTAWPRRRGSGAGSSVKVQDRGRCS